MIVKGDSNEGKKIKNDQDGGVLSVLLRQEKLYRDESIKSLKWLQLMDWYKTMSKWSYDVADYCDVNFETVEIALRILHSYIGNLDSEDVTSDLFQIATMTSLFLAVKAHGSARIITPYQLQKLSRHKILAKNITNTETEILVKLNWRVNPPTIMAFAWSLIDLIPERSMNSHERHCLLTLVKKQGKRLDI